MSHPHVARIWVLLSALFALCVSGFTWPLHQSTTPNQIDLPPEITGTLDAICSNIVAEIEARHFASVAVFGGAWTAQDYTELGDSIGNALSSRLAAKASGFKMIERNALQNMLESDRMSPLMADNVFSAQWLAAELKIPAIAAITLTDWKGSSITVHVLLLSSDVSHANSLAGWKFDLPLSPSLLASLHRSLLNDDQRVNPSKAKGHKATRGSREYPECESCPRPDYTPEARDHHWRGDVRFSALITTEGAATEILVLQGAPYQIDRAAISGLKQWKFKPALDSHKLPVAKQTQIVETFELQ